MSSMHSGFLAKSIVLLGLVLLCMAASLYLGKELGRNIMALTRSNIQERFGDTTPVAEGDGGGFVLDAVGSRSGFGYDPEEFGSNQFRREWADPTEEELSVVSDEPVVEITVLDEAEDESSAGDGGDDAAGSSGTSVEESSRGTSIFDLGDATEYRIQVGTFAERSNAESVWRRLTQAGYDAHISTYTDAGVVQYRVQVGGYHSREEADLVAEELRSMNFNAWVIRVE